MLQTLYPDWLYGVVWFRRSSTHMSECWRRQTRADLEGGGESGSLGKEYMNLGSRPVPGANRTILQPLYRTASEPLQ